MEPVFTLFDHVSPPYGRINLPNCNDCHPLPSVYSVNDGIKLVESLASQDRISGEEEAQLEEQILMSTGLLMFPLSDPKSRAEGEAHSRFRIERWLKRKYLEEQGLE